MAKQATKKVAKKRVRKSVQHGQLIFSHLSIIQLLH